MKAFYCDHFELPLPEGHRFPADKYPSLRRRIQSGDLAGKVDLCVPFPASDEQIRRVHTEEYLEKIIQGTLSEWELRRIGFPWSQELVERSRHSVGGTIAACRAALSEGLAVNLAGGTHHAHADHGQGFCLLNDVAIAARAMQDEHLAKRILILDCDVHQGNGTAAIFEGDTSVYTFSIHGARNFPFHKVSGNLDLALPDKTGDKEYLSALALGLQQAFDEVSPELILYIAGADPFQEDRLGRLALSKDGLAQRDRMVLEHFRHKDIPAAIVLGGGYGKRVADTVDIHYKTIRLAVEAAEQWGCGK